MTPELRGWYDLMIHDGVRERAYRAALARCARGRVVVDVGAGLGHSDGAPWFYWSPDTWAPIHVHATGAVRALGFAFSASLAPGVVLTNLPGHPPTHWRQGAMPLADELEVTQGDTIMLRGRISPTGADRCDVGYELGVLPR